MLIILVCLVPGLIGFGVVTICYGDLAKYREQPLWLVSLQYIYRSLIFACAWPLIGVIYVVYLIDERKRKLKDAVREMSDAIDGKFRRKGRLSFMFGMGGRGIVSCEKCGYREEVVSFLHGFGEDPWSNTGFQCQQCGKLHAIERVQKLNEIPPCECGGRLSRDDDVFCPACGSFNVVYDMTMIT